MENDSSSSKSSVDEIINKVFFKKYHCIKKLGEGSFGRIYEAVYNSEHFALKFEDINSNSNLLSSEASIMNYLKGPNIPLVRSYGTSGNYNILIMQLMGKSLEDLINIKKTFPLKTVSLIGYQMINVLEYIHNKHIVHRDLKPDNFVVGLNDLAKYLYLLDFGLAKKYRSSVTLKQYPLINKKKLTGTARYASINALRGFEQSRRDDLESAGYVLMYFLRGSLPWQGIPGKNKEERYKKILQKKEGPDYDRLRDFFVNVLDKENEVFDYIYVWSTPEEIRQRKKEYSEEKHHIKRRKNTSKTNSVSYLPTKIESTSNKNYNNFNANNEEKIKRKEKRNTTHANLNNKYLDEEEKVENRNNEKKITTNFKFATKENSVAGVAGKNNQILNSPAVSSRKNSRMRTHNIKRKSSKFDNDELKKENEEVCCTEACIVV